MTIGDFPEALGDESFTRISQVLYEAVGNVQFSDDKAAADFQRLLGRAEGAMYQARLLEEGLPEDARGEFRPSAIIEESATRFFLDIKTRARETGTEEISSYFIQGAMAGLCPGFFPFC